MKKLILLRRFSQTLFLLLFIYTLWYTTYPLSGTMQPAMLFKLDPLLMMTTSIAERVLIRGLLLAVLMLLVSAIFGRFFCGWICPLGTMIDGVGAVMRKRTQGAPKQFRFIKYLIAAFLFIAACFGYQLAWICDPIVIAARSVSMNFIPAITLALNNFFIFILKATDTYQPLYDIYRGLKSGLLGVKVHFFSNSGLIFLNIVIILALSLIVKRFWCRGLCPLGGMYALFSSRPFLKRHVDKCVNCGRCKTTCRMGAIKDDASYMPGECILCMDCVYDCPVNRTYFSFVHSGNGKKEAADSDKSGKITRRSFLFLMAAGMAALGAPGNVFALTAKKKKTNIIRPPGAIEEKDFLARCIRCGNCMKVCPTNGLQPVMFKAGLEGIWTPELVPEIGYCEYQCTLCGDVCPTGAIKKLSHEKKAYTKLGLAQIDKKICIAWAENKECIVCEEHCPIYDKAIKAEEAIINGKKILRPSVDLDLCVGCGICQNKCPTRPVRAIRVVV